MGTLSPSVHCPTAVSGITLFAAAALALPVPLPLLGRADEVIEQWFAACLKWVLVV